MGFARQGRARKTAEVRELADEVVTIFRNVDVARESIWPAEAAQQIIF